MPISRRHAIALACASAAGAVATTARAAGGPVSAFGIDASQFGLRPGSPDDQSRALQRAIDETARNRSPLALAPGSYRVAGVRLPAGAQILGAGSGTRLEASGSAPLITAAGADQVRISNLMLDGAGRALPERRALVELESCRGIRIVDCEIRRAGRIGIALLAVGGEITGTTLTESADVAIHAMDSRGLLIARNTVAGAGNNGIQVWRSAPGDDGSIVTDNRIESIANRSGGSGQYGNAVNVFRAANVIVRSNQIRNCAFSAVRGNAASNLQIAGNTIVGVGEVALYAEFGFEGALIAGNTVDGAAIGVSVTNFNEGGRLAVVQGNVIRNLLPRRPAGTDAGDGAGIGIAVEADTAVTGNVIDNAPTAGIMLGFGHYLRNLAVTGNVVRRSDIGIAVSVTPGAGTALIANNVIAETRRGAIVGMARSTPVTGDLAKGGSEAYAHLSLSGNQVR